MRCARCGRMRQKRGMVKFNSRKRSRQRFFVAFVSFGSRHGADAPEIVRGRAGRYGCDRRKNKFPGGDELVAALVMPSSLMLPLKAVQLAVFKSLFCCNVQPAQGVHCDGHDITTLLLEDLRASFGRKVKVFVQIVSVPGL